MSASIAPRAAGSARPALLLGAGVLISFGAVGMALISQHVFDMQPCPWCVLQRLIFVCIGLACVVGLIWRSAAGRRVGAGLALLLALSGITAALWQHFVAAASASCNLTLADRILAGLGLDAALPEIFQPRASCMDAKVDMLHVPYEFWSLTLFVILAIAMVAVLRRPA